MADHADADVTFVTSDFEALEANQISLKTGETVTVLERVTSDWWWVELDNVAGYAPVNHLSNEPLTNDDKWENEEYFDSYGQLKLHSEMLTDVPRTSTYKMAIESASSWLKDKVVLDVGCGTGILSLFCAFHGRPKKVYAVECSNIARYAGETVLLNGYQDVIEVMQSKVETVNLPEKVDLIISEWMGTLLLFEFMIESVIHARDKYLKPGGVMWPSEAELFLVPCSAESVYYSRMGVWSNVYGFDFSPYLPLAIDSLSGKPLHNHVLSANDCLSDAFTILKLDMKTVTVPQLENTEVAYDFLINKSGTLHGFASWFKVHFSQLPHPHTPVCLSTAPDSPPTHWKQDLLLIDSPLQVEIGQRLKGTIQLTRHKLWRRHLRIKLTYSLWQDQSVLNEDVRKVYKAWR